MVIINRPPCCCIDQRTHRECTRDAAWTQWLSDDPEDFIEVCDMHREMYRADVVSETPIGEYKPIRQGNG
jgi:hypothetical protein